MKEYREKQPLVSVVIPTYNRMDTIERSVKSVVDQTYKNIELIVVDDGSADNTLEIIKCMNIENIVILRQNHQGANAARNLGIKQAKGEFIAFQDSDDEWLPDKLERQIVYMLRNRLEVCYCPFYLYGEEYNGIPYSDYRDKEKYEQNLLEVLRIGNVVSTQTLVIHKNILSDVGVFDEEMPRFQDYEYVVRIIQKKKIGYVNEPLAKLYRSYNSISNDDIKRKEGYIKLLEKHENFFDIETYLKNLFSYNADVLNESDMKKKVENIDKCLKKNLDRRKVNVYRIAMEAVSKKYILVKDSHIKEYELRIENLQSYRFAIYGAGKIGKKIYSELVQKNLIPQCFLVTEKQEEEVCGIPVIEISEFDDKSIEIIVGVSKELQNVLIENLIRKGYKNYFRYMD